jgi:hypothetical protein
LYDVNFSVGRDTLFIPAEPNFGFEENDEELDLLIDQYSSAIGSRMKEFSILGSPKTNDKIVGREVGDDRVDITGNPLIAASVLSTQTLIGMKTSEKDTSITQDWWNFCEVTTNLPTSTENTFNKCRKRNDFSKLEFVDAPALRTVIETSKVERIHATSSVGKSAMLGSKLKSSNQTCNAYLQVANLLQDGMLRTADMPDPKYLPSSLGGCNCPDMFRDSYNTYLYMKCFKGGGYDRLYGTATQEAKEAIRLTESGTPTVPLIANGLRGDHEEFFATMKNKIFVPPEHLKKDVREGSLPEPIYEAAGGRNEIRSTESRLIATKKLVTRTQAAVLSERSLKLQKYCLSGTEILRHREEEKTRKARLRACFHGALRGNSAFINLANNKGCEGDVTKLESEGFKVCVSGQPEFKIEHAVWLSEGARGKTLNINDLLRSEDMFFRDEVSGEESMKVSGIQLNVEGKEKFLTQTTVAKVGLYQINSSMREWSDKLSEDLSNLGTRPVPRYKVVTLFSKNREWVNDDTLLISQCAVDCAGKDSSTCVALVSNDKRLANQMARTCNVWTVLVDPLSVVECFPKKEWNSSTVLTTAEMNSKFFPNDKFKKGLRDLSAVYIDTGSLLASLSKVEIEERAFDRMLSIKTPISSFNQNGKRIEMYDLEVLPPNSYLRIQVYTLEGLRGRKQRKPGSYSSSSYSSNYAWPTNVPVNTRIVTHRNPKKFTLKEKTSSH